MGECTDPETGKLHAVWGSDASNVFAVGEEGAILHYNGNTWSSMSSGMMNALYGIWGSGPETSAERKWEIFHYDGTAWSSMNSETMSDLKAVWGTSSSNVFAVGQSGTIRRYNGSSWSDVYNYTHNSLYGSPGSGVNDIFAVGEDADEWDGEPRILHYNGSWVPMQDCGTTLTLHGVWGSDAGNVYAVGQDGTMWCYTGAWSIVDSGATTTLKGIWVIVPAISTPWATMGRSCTAPQPPGRGRTTLRRPILPVSGQRLE